MPSKSTKERRQCSPSVQTFMQLSTNNTNPTIPPPTHQNRRKAEKPPDHACHPHTNPAGEALT
jgi:hypothetical protein